nr:FAD-dependent oxidoreductase [Clostridia bacterium]
TPEGLAEILAGAKRLVPTVNDRAVITSFSGVRPTPSTGDYYIKPSEQVEGLLHLAGIESPGLASSPAVGDYAVELLGSMGLDLRLKPDFRDERPKQVHFAEADDVERAELIKKNPLYGRIICRCETVTEGEIVDAIRRPIGARDIDMVKRRTRAGMGRCQGGFCMPRVAEILSRELGVPLEEVTKCGGKSWLVFKK